MEPGKHPFLEGYVFGHTVQWSLIWMKSGQAFSKLIYGSILMLVSQLRVWIYYIKEKNIAKLFRTFIYCRVRERFIMFFPLLTSQEKGNI